MKSKSIVTYLFKRELSLSQKKLKDVLFTEDVGKSIAEEKATLPNKNQPCELSGQARSTMLVTFSPDGTKIASSHGDHSVRVTDIKTGKCTHILNGHPRTPWCLAFHPSSNDILASGCLGGEVRIWDLRGGGSEAWKADQNLSIASLTFHPTDMVLVIAIANEIKFWDWTQPKPFASCKSSFDFEKIRWVKFDPLGNYLYTGITNRSTVHPEDEEIGFIGSETTSQAERQEMHEQYRRIVEEIMSQRGRTPSGATSSSSSSGGVPRLADAARAPFTNPPPRVDLDAERPHSPTQVDALNNAREYASAISRQSNMNPLDLSQRQTHELLANARYLTSSVSRSSSRGRVEQLLRGNADTTTSATTRTSTSGDAATPSADIRPGTWGPRAGIRSLLDRESTETNPLSRSSDWTVWAPRSQANTQANYISATLSGSGTITTSNGGSLNEGTQSSSNQQAAAPTSRSSISASSSRGISLLQSQLESQSAAPSSSTPSVQQSFFTSMLTMRSDPAPVSRAESLDTSRLMGSAMSNNTVRPVTVVSLPSSPGTPVSSVDRTPSSETVSSLATAVPQQRLGRSSSSGQPGVATVLMSHLWPSTSNTDSSTSTTSSSQISTTAPYRSRLLPSSTSSSSSLLPSRPDQCQICGRYERVSGCRHRCRGHHVSRCSQRTSTSESTRSVSSAQPSSSSSASSTSATATSSSRSRPGSQTIASLIESEVRQTLNQVRARRLDISETLRDLDNLRRELETTPRSEGNNNDDSQPAEGAQVNGNIVQLPINVEPPNTDSDTRLPSAPPTAVSTPVSLSLPNMDFTTSALGSDSSEHVIEVVESVQEPDVRETPSDDPPRQIPLIVVDPYEEESGNAIENVSAYRDTSRSASEDPLSLPTDPRLPSSNTEALQHIGMFSAELERRVHQLDQRVTEIQDRLRDRMNALQREREQDLSSVRCRLAAARGNSRPQSQSLRERLMDRREQQSSRTLMRSHIDELRSRNRSARLQMAREPTPAAEGSPRSPVMRRDFETRAARFRRAQEVLRRRQQQRDQRQRDRSWHTLQRRHLHPDYSVSILDDTVNRNDGLQAAINRAIAGAFMATGEASVASNIINQTFRIQRWDMSCSHIPDITNSEANIIVPQCKLHNDSSVDISQDGRLLATFVHTHRGFPDDYILAVYSLNPDNLGQCLYTKSFGPNAITVSLSPCNSFALVGLASKRLAWVFAPKQMVAQVYKLNNQQAGEDSTEHVCDIMHPSDMDIRTPVSLNTARWLPGVGEGITYGTNRGDLHIYRPGYEEEEKSNTSDSNAPESNSIRRNLMQMLGMTVPRTMSIATQTVQRVRRTASTQTDGVNPGENPR